MNKEEILKVLEDAGVQLFTEEFFLELDSKNQLDRSLLFYGTKGEPYELLWWDNLMYLKVSETFTLIFDDIRLASPWPIKTFKNHLEFRYQGSTVGLIGVN